MTPRPATQQMVEVPAQTLAYLCAMAREAVFDEARNSSFYGNGIEALRTCEQAHLAAGQRIEWRYGYQYSEPPPQLERYPYFRDKFPWWAAPVSVETHTTKGPTDG